MFIISNLIEWVLSRYGKFKKVKSDYKSLRAINQHLRYIRVNEVLEKKSPDNSTGEQK